MFLHKGDNRTFLHNLRVAVLLSFVGGLVNVAGFLSLKFMTTNVTGYLPNFVDNLIQFRVNEFLKVFSLLFSFFFGAFISHFFLQLQSVVLKKVFYTVPLILEFLLLIAVAYKGEALITQGYLFETGYFLLFSMGLQNSLVTFISNSVVRTTHVTGIFTDLGIEMAQLIFKFRQTEERKKLYTTIGLKLAIVISFCIGGVVAAYTYPFYGLSVLYIAALIIFYTSVYDFLIVKMMSVIEDKIGGPVMKVFTNPPSLSITQKKMTNEEEKIKK